MSYKCLLCGGLNPEDVINSYTGLQVVANKAISGPRPEDEIQFRQSKNHDPNMHFTLFRRQK